MQYVLTLISKNWIIILISFIMIMMILRLVTSNPKYSIKQIIKKPWLIFQLLARAAADTIEILDDIQGKADKLEKEIEETTEKIEDIRESVGELKESVSDTAKENKE